MKRSFVAFVVLAVALRLPGLFTELWLDEIRALSNVAAIDSAAAVFTEIHHDSNHWVVGLWMYAVGREAPFWLYRLPSFLAGVAAVVAVGWLARLDGSNPRLAMLLSATSFPLIFYSSEARGYALAALAGLTLLGSLVRWVETGLLRWFALYSFAAALGILSHLSFVLVVVATAAYAFVLAGRGVLSPWRALAVPLVPGLVLAGLFVVDLRFLTIGGGTTGPPRALLAQTASLAVGGPLEGPGVLPAAVLAVVVLGCELARRVRRFWPNRQSTEARSYLWVFFAVITLLPAWTVLVLEPPFVFPRYFLVSIAFTPLLAASLVSALSRPSLVLIAGAWLGLNGCSLARFASEGRGCYAEALRFLLESSDADVVRVGSDHDLRNGRIVAFYRERIGEAGTRLEYVTANERSEFWIVSYEGSRCDGCRILRSYPSSALSGARWSLYRTESR